MAFKLFSSLIQTLSRLLKRDKYVDPPMRYRCNAEPTISFRTDDKIKKLIEERDRIVPPNVDWFNLTYNSSSSNFPSTFSPESQPRVKSLKSRKADRKKKEQQELATKKAREEALISRASSLAAQIHSAVESENLSTASSTLQDLLSLKVSSSIGQVSLIYNNSKKEVDNLSEVLRQRKIQEEAEHKRRLLEHQRIIEENERKRKEELRKKQEEEKRRREERARKLLEQQREKERKEREEKERLDRLRYKEGKDEIAKILSDNGIHCLYHFTDMANLASIREHGYLYSWDYCERNGIVIKNPGGDQFSRNLDVNNGLENYVRLSFCNDHPMMYRLEQDGYNLVLLRIKVDVAWLRNTKFSRVNVASANPRFGDRIADLRNIDFAATKRSFVSTSDPDFKTHQAEVLVYEKIPVEYIMNLDRV